MPNSLVATYRKNLASQGLTDSRDDLLITQEFGQMAQQQAPELFTQYPDFGEEYGQIRGVNAPSLPGEFGRALKSGTQGLLATGAGLGALATDSDTLKRAAISLEQDAAQNAPTVGTLEDIAPGRTGLRKALSMDTLRYLAAKAGGAIPSLAEMAGTAAAGAAIGTAAEPGVGTVVGAGEGAIEGILGRGIIKSAIKRLVQSGVAGELTEVGVADAIRAGDQKLADLVTQQAKSLVARRAGEAVNLANIYGTTSGGIYNETGRRDLALGVGAVGSLPFAIPGVSLASQTIERLFPDLAPAAAQKAAQKLVGDKTAQVLARLGRSGQAVAGGTAGVVAMEASNIVAKNLSEGRDALDLSPDDWKRLRESAIAGAVAAAPFGAAAAMEPRRVAEARPGGPKTVVSGEVQPAGAEVVPPEDTQVAPPETPVSSPPASTTADLVRNVTTLTDEQKVARLAELTAKALRTPQEEQQFQVLKATVKAPPPAPVAQPVPAVVPEPSAEVPPPAAPPAPAAPAEVAAAQPAPIPVPVAPPAAAPVATEEFALPRELSGAKPRYGYGDKQFTLNFASDLDKALYILAQKTPSKQDAKFLETVLKQTGMTEEQARAAGADVRDAIKAKAKDSPAGNLTIETVFEFKPQQPAAPAAPAPAGPNPARGRRISVGAHPGAGDDILNEIEQLGGVRPKSAAKNPGGEYDDINSSFTGVARLLLRKEGLAPDELAQYLHDNGFLPDASVTSMTDAVAKAVRAREMARKQVGNEQVMAKFEQAFLGNENPRKWLRAGKPISIDDLNGGDSFTVNGEKFTVKAIDENGNVTIEDGISRTVPPGTLVFPDKGKVRRVKGGKMFAPEATAPELAPATYATTQDFGAAGKVELYTLTKDIPGHPEGSTVSRETLEKAGYEVPQVLTYRDAGYESPEKFLSDYEKRGIHDAFETADEFMRRIFCSAQ